MADVFDGAPDARQAAENIPVSRFRMRYRALSATELALHDSIQAKAAELEALIDQVGKGRYCALAMTNLELAVIWAVKELTSNPA